MTCFIFPILLSPNLLYPNWIVSFYYCLLNEHDKNLIPYTYDFFTATWHEEKCHVSKFMKTGLNITLRANNMLNGIEYIEKDQENDNDNKAHWKIQM